MRFEKESPLLDIIRTVPHVVFEVPTAREARAASSIRSFGNGSAPNHLLQMPFEAFLFRPGFIQPLKGVRSKTKLYQAVYDVLGPLYPLLKRLAPGHVTTSENVGRAMIRVAASGYSKRVLENPDINALAVAS